MLSRDYAIYITDVHHRVTRYQAYARPIFPRARGESANERCFARVTGTEWKEERTHSTEEREKITCGANKRRSASAYNERKKERQPNARIRWLLSMYASLTLRTFALPYGRHRLPLTVSQRSLCNILSSLNGARYAVQSPRKDYPRMCFTRSGQRPAPGVGNVRREWEGCAEKRGKRERERHTAKRGPPDIARLPPLAPFLPR